MEHRRPGLEPSPSQRPPAATRRTAAARGVAAPAQGRPAAPLATAAAGGASCTVAARRGRSPLRAPSGRGRGRASAGGRRRSAERRRGRRPGARPPRRRRSRRCSADVWHQTRARDGVAVEVSDPTHASRGRRRPARRRAAPAPRRRLRRVHRGRGRTSRGRRVSQRRRVTGSPKRLTRGGGEDLPRRSLCALVCVMGSPPRVRSRPYAPCVEGDHEAAVVGANARASWGRREAPTTARRGTQGHRVCAPVRHGVAVPRCADGASAHRTKPNASRAHEQPPRW